MALGESFDTATKTFPESKDSADLHQRMQLLRETAWKYITPGDIEKPFVKGNMKLISDIWALILDVYDDCVVLKSENTTFARYLYNATMVTRPTLITLVYEPESSTEVTISVKTNEIINTGDD